MNEGALEQKRLWAPCGAHGPTLEGNPLCRGEGSSAGLCFGWRSHQECVIHGLLDWLDEASPVPVASISLTFVKWLKGLDLERQRRRRGASACPFDATKLS